MFRLKSVFLGLLLLFTIAMELSCAKSEEDRREKLELSPHIRCDGKGEVESYGIIGGKTLSMNSRLAKAVVYIVTSWTNKKTGQVILEASCTGGILDTNIILAAGHCFAEPPIENVAKENIEKNSYVYSAYRPSCLRVFDVEGVKVERVIVHEDYGSKSAIAQRGDVALLRTAVAIPGEHTYYTLDRNTHNFTELEKLVIVGYGKTVGYKTREDSDRPLKFGYVQSNKDKIFQDKIVSYYNEIEQKDFQDLYEKELTKARTEARKSARIFTDEEQESLRRKVQEDVHKDSEKKKFKFDYANTNENLVFNQSSGDAVCAGDSGGPGFRIAGDSLRWVGVAQAVLNINPYREACKFGAVYTSVSYYQSWIIKNFNSLINSDTQVHRDGESLYGE